MVPFVKFIFLLLLTMVGAATASPIFGNPKTRVIIQNMLSDGQYLSFHCKSKDDDLGEQALKGGETWGFSFRPNIWGSTLFHCQFWWPSLPSPHHFNIYQQGRDSWCQVCAWVIHDANPCIGSTCYSWNSSPSTLTLFK